MIDGHVVGVEDIEGTDGLLARIARLRRRPHSRQGRARRAGKGAGADRICASIFRPSGRAPWRRWQRPDLPASRSSAGNTIVVEPQAMIEAADAAGLFVMACRREPATSHRRGRAKNIPDRHGRVRRPLGASLMKELRQRLGGAVRFEGVGGQAMARGLVVALFRSNGCRSWGFRLLETGADAATAHQGNRRGGDAGIARVLVIIDSPDFTHRVARVSGRATPRSRSSITYPLGMGGGRPGARDVRLY